MIAGETGVLFDELTPASMTRALEQVASMRFDHARLRSHAEQFSRERHAERMQAVIDETLGRAGGSHVVRRYNRLLVAFYVVSDALLAMWAFILAYGIRFESGLIPVDARLSADRAVPATSCRSSALLTPLAFQLQGIYRLRRGRSRVDDFFAVLIGSILAVVFGVVCDAVLPGLLRLGRGQGARRVRGLAGRLGPVPRPERRCSPTCHARPCASCSSAGGAPVSASSEFSSPARAISDAWLPTVSCSIASSAIRSSASLTIGPAAITSATAGCRCSARWPRSADIAQRERIDHLYVALPLEEHTKLLDLVELTSRECIDVKVVPDLLQFIALRARLEDLDGLPIININDVPLQGFNAWMKRVIDIGLSAAALIVLAIPVAIIAAHREAARRAGRCSTRRSGWDSTARRSPSTSFDRCTRTPSRTAGPVWARRERPARDADRPLAAQIRPRRAAAVLERACAATCRSSARGPNGRSSSSSSSTASRSMLRHKVKAGITGWAQVNGWRGNTSLEKRIEYDLYYIENWSVTLDIKIMWLTVFRGLFQRVTENRASASSPAPRDSSDPISAKRCSIAATR